MTWPMVAIKDVAKVVTGKTPSKSEDDNFGGEIPFVTPAELNGIPYVSSSPQTITEKGASKLKLVPRNSVMVCCIGSLGKLAIAGREVATNQQINSVIFDEKRVDPKYGYYALSKLKPVMEKLAPSTTVAIINKSNFEALEIPLPPLVEQQRIAAILDKADAIRRKRQQAIQLADDFLRAVFLDMFGDPVTNPKGWDVRALSNLIDESRGVSYGVVQRGEQVDGGIPLVRISDIATNEFRPEDVVKCSKSISDQYRRTILRGGELLISIRGTVGRVAEVPSMAAGWNISREVAVIPILSGVSSSFLKRLLISSPIQRSLAGQIKGVAQSGINLADLRNLPVICPPAAIIEDFELAERKIREKYIVCAEKINGNELFSSLSQKAFAGLL